MLAVDPVGLSGGIALLWKDGTEVAIQNLFRRHINATITLINSMFSWKLTGFYGHPNRACRKDSWRLLEFLKDFTPSSWLCVGDFNEITNQSKKSGGDPRCETQMASFRSVLEDYNLNDLGFKGSKFTWTNCREADQFTKVRLDHAVANPAWCS